MFAETKTIIVPRRSSLDIVASGRGREGESAGEAKRAPSDDGRAKPLRKRCSANSGVRARATTAPPVPGCRLETMAKMAPNAHARGQFRECCVVPSCRAYMSCMHVVYACHVILFIYRKHVASGHIMSCNATNGMCMSRRFSYYSHVNIENTKKHMKIYCHDVLLGL